MAHLYQCERVGCRTVSETIRGWWTVSDDRAYPASVTHHLCSVSCLRWWAEDRDRDGAPAAPVYGVQIKYVSGAPDAPKED